MPSVNFRALQRIRRDSKHVYYKKLAHMIMEADTKSALRPGSRFRQGSGAGLVLRPSAWRLGRVDGAKTGRRTPGDAAGISRLSAGGVFSWLVGPVSVLFRPPADWMRPSTFMEGPMLHSMSTDFNVNLTQKHSSSKYIKLTFTPSFLK